MRIPRLLLLLALMAALTANAQEPATGRLLIANPVMPDATFSETVLLLLRHDSEVSLGVFLNRPTWLDAAETFPEVEGLEAYAGRLFRGGPVLPTQLLLLLEVEGAPPTSTQRIIDSIYLGTEPAVLRDLALAGENPPRARVYAGYTVWGQGQLEDEIAAGSWRVLPVNTDYVFSENPEALWRRLVSAGDGLSAAVR